jgi:UDP-glucose 4-epimerase
LHTAAVVGPGADENPGQAFQVNVAATWNLIEVTRIRSLARLVLVSSNSVYANDIGPPDQTLHENTPYHEPDSYYGASKAMAEIMALVYHRLAGLNLVICRPCAVYGRGGFVGGSKSGKAINETLIEAIGATPGSKVAVDVPTAERVYAKDVAVALREALFVEKLSTRVYNVGSGEIVTAAMIVDAIRSVLPHVNPVVASTPAPENVRLLDTTLARNELGYQPQWPLARAVPDYVSELQQLGPYRP